MSPMRTGISRASLPVPHIELADGAEANGLARMIGDLIRQNLEDHPDKRADFGRMLGRVALVAEDAEVRLTLEIDPNRLTVHDGIVGIPDITIRASSEDIINLSLMELTPRLRLPDPRGAINRQVWQATREGRIQMYGTLANFPLALRLTRVMSVN